MDVPSPESPVISNLLKASTSNDARPGLITFVGTAACPRSGCSIISKVFENGFAGALLGFSTSSSSDVSEFVLSKGSSSRGIGVGGFADIEYVSSPIVEVESGIEGDSGGGDCTRTFFVIFFGTSIFSGSAAPKRGSAC